MAILTALNLQACITNLEGFPFNIAETSSSNEPKEIYESPAVTEPPPLKDGLPKRLITVVGLEESGTVFMHMVLHQALGLKKVNPEESMNSDRSIVLQHTSLPAGYATGPPPAPVIPVNILYTCRLPKTDHSLTEEQCNNIYGMENSQVVRRIPSRSYVNITSHIQWYRERGVDATAVILVRDAGIRIHGAQRYCQTDPVCFQEYLKGREIIQQAVDPVSNVNHVLVSYETLMSVQKPYLFQIYKALGLKNDTNYLPLFKNANLKYLRPDVPSPAIREELTHDVGRGTDVHVGF